MNWQKPARYAQVSTCGRYSVAKIGFNGGACYELWQTRAHPEGSHLVATNLKSSQEARELAEQHDASL